MKRHDVRTGFRKPKNYLKAWSSESADWTRRLTPRLSVSMVDEELPFGKEGGRKSWYIGLTQPKSVGKTIGSVRHIPFKGDTLVLFEDDVLAVVEHLLNAELVVLTDDHRIANGPAEESLRREQEDKTLKALQRKRKQKK